MTALIRDAGPDDTAAIARIYNHAVLHTTAIWNDIVVDAENRAAWLAARTGAGYPVLVAEVGGEVRGYASFGDFRAFDGYRMTVEHSVYVDHEARGAGIGRALMVALIGRARALDKHVMVAAIEAGNEASRRLHRSLGFTETGLMPQVGTKFGRWLDLRLMQLTLDGRDPR